jgi:hypothetical protein
LLDAGDELRSLMRFISQSIKSSLSRFFDKKARKEGVFYALFVIFSKKVRKLEEKITVKMFYVTYVEKKVLNLSILHKNRIRQEKRWKYFSITK